MSPSSPDALYQPIPQESIPILSELDSEDDHESATTTFDSRTRQIQFLLGCAVLLPWNAMITALPYFLSRLAASPLRTVFSSYLSTTFTAANFVFLAHATITSKQTPPSRKIIQTLVYLSFTTFLLTLSTFIRVSPGIFFAFCLIIGVLQASLGAYLQTSIIAIASLFGPTAVQTVMAGQAAVGVAVSAVQVSSAVVSTWGSPVTTTAIASEPQERSAFIFFGLSTLFLLFTALAQRWLSTVPTYQAVIQHLERKPLGDGSPFDKQRILRVAKANWLYQFAGGYVLLITLAVFPPITTSVQPTNPNTHPLLFSAIHFLMFASGDLLGRYLCSVPRFLVWSAKRLTIFSLARTCFIPLFLMCNIQRPSASPTVSPPTINSDWMFMFILLLFGTSSGYVSSMYMMAAPSLEHNRRLRGRKDDVDIAATVASFCLVGGLALGSVASFAVRGAICSCNPFLE